MSVDWEVKRLRDVCKIEKIQNSRTDIPYVGMEDIESGTGKFLGSKEPQTVKSSSFFFTPDHILYGRLRPYLNKVLLPNFEGHCSTEVFPIKTSPSLNKRFLYYWFSSDEIVTKINQTCTGARMPRANMNEVIDFEIPVPPIEEQRRIVAMLDEAMAGVATAVTNTERNLVNGRELFTSTLQSIFTNPPASWGIKELQDLCKIGDGNHSSKYPKKEEMVESGIPFIRSVNFSNGRISNAEMRYITEEKHRTLKKGHLKTGDVLFTNRGEIGKLAIVDEQFDNANLNSQIAWFRCSKLLDNKYLYYVLLSPQKQRQFNSSQTGAALQQFTIRMINQIEIAFPPMDEQRAIVAQLDDLAAQTRQLEAIYQQKLAALTELKQSILQRAFTPPDLRGF